MTTTTLTNEQKKELFDLLVNANGGVSTGIAAWAEKQGLPRLHTCPLCGSTHYLYPYFLHRITKHGDSYYETLKDM